MLEDLEQQAEGLALAERDAEVAELGRAAYSTVDLASRVHASLGRQVSLEVLVLGRLSGRLSSAGAGWLLLGAPATEWLVPLPRVTAFEGLSEWALTPVARPLTARLGFGSVLRRLAEQGDRVTAVRSDGARVAGLLRRVGADFVEVVPEGRAGGRLVLLPVDHLVAVGRT